MVVVFVCLFFWCRFRFWCGLFWGLFVGFVQLVSYLWRRVVYRILCCVCCCFLSLDEIAFWPFGGFLRVIVVWFLVLVCWSFCLV